MVESGLVEKDFVIVTDEEYKDLKEPDAGTEEYELLLAAARVDYSRALMLAICAAINHYKSNHHS
eukprot:CAMPEP_0201285992 /NCGR_PEP_ID=MMETSP1317-20130820/114134_1 /ASSEMBLY_ACC=CAM_ASM_000770 /TAXON_ID=187299 /ORGANISM="Undescribed Undescribed, Strain Undescribed" /LENGTH=64 /DNA_ID=CAMNT_0047612353 /DNA_START=509 /DNA_END=703 /DNA_ORIENTATION=+